MWQIALSLPKINLPNSLQLDYLFFISAFGFCLASDMVRIPRRERSAFANILQLSLRGTHSHVATDVNCRISATINNVLKCFFLFFIILFFFVSFDCRDLSCKFVSAAISRQ